MQTGKFKFYNTLNDLLIDFRLYLCNVGLVVTLCACLMAAARYTVMMLREAKTLEPPPPFVMPRRARGGWMAS